MNSWHHDDDDDEMNGSDRGDGYFVEGSCNLS